jgi:hypothetical protein
MMDKLKKMALVTALIMLPFFIANVNAQKKVKLSYNLQAGNSYLTTIDLDQDIVFEANGQPMTLDQRVVFKTTSSIANQNADSTTISTTIDAVRMEQSIFGMEIIYDSEDTSTLANPMAVEVGKAMEKVLGASIGTVIDEHGNVLRYNLGSLGENTDMGNNLSSGNSYVVFPGAKVAVGDSWEADITPMKNSDMKSHSKYTHNKIGKKTVVIGVVSTITSNAVEGEEMKMKGTISGELIVDRKSGWTLKSEMDMETELELEQNGMKFPATISGTILLGSEQK